MKSEKPEETVSMKAQLEMIEMWREIFPEDLLEEA